MENNMSAQGTAEGIKRGGRIRPRGGADQRAVWPAPGRHPVAFWERAASSVDQANGQFCCIPQVHTHRAHLKWNSTGA